MVQALSSILLIFILPVALLLTGVIPARHKMRVLTAGTAMAIILTLVLKIPSQELGVRTDNLTAALVPYVLFTAFGLAVSDRLVGTIV